MDGQTIVGGWLNARRFFESRLTDDAGQNIVHSSKCFDREPKVLDSTTALELPDVPNRLLFVGGGYIGLERVSLDDIARQAQPTTLHPQHGVHYHG